MSDCGSKVLQILPHKGGGGERYVEALAQLEGFTHDLAYLSPTRNPLRGLAAIAFRRLTLTRLAGRYAFVHVHGDAAAMLTVPLASRAPMIITTHGLSFLRRARGVVLAAARRQFARAAKTAAAVVCTSEAEREELAAFCGGAAGARLQVVPNGVALPNPPLAAERLAARRSFGAQSDDLVCLFLGYLDPAKDPWTAVEAVRAVRAEGLPLLLLLGGDGPLRGALSRRGDAAVKVLGQWEDTRQLFAAADIFLMPSQREGSPYALLDAMAYGLPIVAAAAPGTVELVEGVGLLVPSGDVGRFADALATLARDRSLREALGERARRRACERFSAQRFLDAMAELYATLGGQAAVPR